MFGVPRRLLRGIAQKLEQAPNGQVADSLLPERALGALCRKSP